MLGNKRLLAVASSLALTLGCAATADASNLNMTNVVGHARVVLDSGASITTPTFTADNEQVVVLQPWETADLLALKAANPNVKVLMYQDAAGASNSVGPDGLYSSGVSYNQAEANGWLLLNSTGDTFSFSGYPWLYAADIGSTGYQDAWASNVIAELKSAPWNGVFMDDVNPTIKWDYCVTCVAKYPSDAAYGGAMTSLVENVGEQIQAAGKLAVANIGSWPSYTSVTDGWLQYLSGGMDQQFLKFGTTAGTGYQAPSTWLTQLQEDQLAESEGKIFIGVTNSTNTDEAAADYGYATELLVGKGNSLFFMGADWANEPWFPEYSYGLGSPLGAYTVNSNGVYQRVFTDGLALVNPTTSSQAVSLGGTYTGSGLTGVTSVKMGPQSGLILQPTSTPPTSTPPTSTTPTSTPPTSTTPAPTPAPTTVAPANTAAPSISGSASEGFTLTASAGKWSGTPTPTRAYQWKRCTSRATSSCTAISRATGSTYTVQSADVGDRLIVVVTAANRAGSATAAAAMTAAVPSPRRHRKFARAGKH